MHSFIKNEEESCIYKWAVGSIVIFLILYVNDILLIENDISTLRSITFWLSSQFSIKNLREASNILGMKIYRDRSKRLIRLSLSMYIEFMSKIYSIMYTIYETGYGILTRVVSGYL